MRTPASIIKPLLVVGAFGVVAGPLLAAERPPAVRWDFGTEETSPLSAHGSVHRDVPGPRPPEYPDFEAGNTAVRLDGRGAHFSFDDPGSQSPFDFANGDAVTLEAWVQVDEIRTGENVYVIGKGRTGATGFAADNQNWALRLRGQNSRACISFLFATAPLGGVAKSDAHWHRWTTNDGFKPGKAWHHIAVAYRFGEPESVRGWIDGKPQPGSWDMGGASAEPPVVDDDQIWIGSSSRGASSNSFRGGIDSVAVHRQALDDAVMKTRFRRTGAEPDEVVAKPAPATMPDLGPLPSGRVLAVVHPGFPEHTRWLNEGETTPAELTRFDLDAFLLDRLPQHFDDWGIREAWKAPVLVRLAADVQLPPGTRRFLLRARGLSRLWVDGKLATTTTKPITGSPSGEEPITPVAEPPKPGLRSAEHRQQEAFGEAEVRPDGPTRIVLETIIGGAKFRPDPGELLVAVETADGKSFELLDAATQHLPLTDGDVLAALERTEARLDMLDDERRRAASSKQDDSWSRRHAAARNWVQRHPAVEPTAKQPHLVDAFLQSKADGALAEAANASAAESKEFYDRVLPILREQCFRCHGEKDNGALRLNTRAAALKGGESELPAVVPGKPDDSELLRRIRSTDAEERMPPGGDALSSAQIAVLEKWIADGASWPAPPVTAADVTPPATIDDAAFLRRLTLDVIGLPPTEAELRAFLKDTTPEKRTRAVDRLLADERWADHWVSYWQDALAENPTLINSSLNTTGPFRWFLYDALRDNKPFDRWVTELILMRGGPHDGGSAGFGIAGDNDSPPAAKAQIIAGTFLGIELQCARCHDSPFHSTRQADLYGLAAMLDRKATTVPKTSRVPAAFFERKVRESLIKATLNVAEPVKPHWPFAAATGSRDDDSLNALLHDPKDSRERLAALVTAPQNERFAQVLVNRIWRRLMGAGFVEPAHDWEGRTPSHPELLGRLAREFVLHDYDLKHLTRLILTSQAYQREAVGRNLTAPAELRFFLAPDRRRLSAEQVVDSMYAAAGMTIDVEELTFDPDGRRPQSNRLTLGVPERAWMFANLANERDRPSLNLPRARAVVDVLSAFGWNGARQSPRTDRETAPNVQQPGVLENGVAAVWLTTAAAGSDLAAIAVEAESPAALVDSLYLRYLGRFPTDSERIPLQRALTDGFAERLVPKREIRPQQLLPPLPRVTWANHLSQEANAVALQLESRSRQKPLPDPRLQTAWREAYEDVVWSVLNLREFVWIP